MNSAITQNPVIAVAPNGARKAKADHHALPLTPAEIAEEAENCLQAGAGMIHLHVRDETFQHSLSVSRYQQVIDSIQARCGDKLFIQITSEAVGKYTANEQFDMILALQPNAVSIAMREIQSLATDIITKHFETMRDRNIWPQLILYNEADLQCFIEWLDSGVLPGKAYPILFVIGKPGLDDSFNKDLLTSDLTQLSQLSSWMVCAFGEQEFSVCQQAILNGGHVRIGFENNTLLRDGSIAASNAALVTQMNHFILEEINKRPADAIQASTIMRPNW